MESNKQERKNLMDDMPIDNRGSALNYGKPTSPVAMRMAATKSGLPMKESQAMMYDKSPMAMRETPLMKALVGNQDKLPEALQAEIKASPAKMYGGKKGDMSKSRRDYK